MLLHWQLETNHHQTNSELWLLGQLTDPLVLLQIEHVTTVVIPNLAAMRLWVIRNGGILAGIPGNEIQVVSQLQLLLFRIIRRMSIKPLFLVARQVYQLEPSIKTNVSTADGTPTPVTGEDSIELTDNLNFDYVLVVPSLNYNLLYVTCITLALHYILIFRHHYCVLQDIRTRKMIGYRVRRWKVYHLDLASDSTRQLTQVLSVDVGVDFFAKLPCQPCHTDFVPNFLYHRLDTNSIFYKFNASSKSFDISSLNN
ncbi:hypothetical protein ACFX2I_000883 [Malus domestica]